MGEPKDLGAARDRLAKAEAILMTAEGLAVLKEGLTLLESVIDRDAGSASESVARNLGHTYTSRVYARVRRMIEDDPNLPQPELEHLFAVVRAFDDQGFELPASSSGLKIALVRRLIDLYYEGHSAAEKEKAYQRLAEISGARNGAQDRRWTSQTGS